jgi:type I restriction enzyme M protein
MDKETEKIIKELWQAFWEGGITDVFATVEQISYLIFMKRMELLDDVNKDRAEGLDKKFESIYAKLDEDGNDYGNCRWSEWKNESGDVMLTHVKDRVFPFMKNLHNEDSNLLNEVLSGASFIIDDPSLLQTAIRKIDKLDILSSPDIQGDIFELLLSQLQESGKNGQFRTPRHIIKMMNQIINPQIGEKICDPACGTGGFLIGAYEHIVRHHTSDEIFKTQGLRGEKLGKEKWDILFNETLFGNDFDRLMFKISTFNMVLHGIKNPNLSRINGLSKQFDNNSRYHVILANPPFTGTIDKDSLNPKVDIGGKKTELLFLKLFYNLLEPGGRAAVIVPIGVLSGSSNAHKAVKNLLLEKCSLDAIVYLPSGVFNPYTAVSTAIIFFTKGGSTKKVWLYKMENDGFKLDNKHIEPIEENDIEDILEKYPKREKSKKSLSISIDEIKKNDYNFSVLRYIDNSVPEEQIDIQQTIDNLLDLKKASKSSEDKIMNDLKDFGFKV